MEELSFARLPRHLRLGKPGHKQSLSQANQRALDLQRCWPSNGSDPQGMALRQLRLNSTLSAAQLASLACISLPQLLQLENGEDSLFYSASLRNQAGRRVAKLLGADWDRLTGSEGASLCTGPSLPSCASQGSRHSQWKKTGQICLLTVAASSGVAAIQFWPAWSRLLQ